MSDVEAVIQRLHAATVELQNERTSQKRIEKRIEKLQEEQSLLVQQFTSCNYHQLIDQFLQLLDESEQKQVLANYPDCAPFLRRLGVRVCDVIARTFASKEDAKTTNLDIADVLRQAVVRDGAVFRATPTFVKQLENFYHQTLNVHAIRLAVKLESSQKQINLQLQAWMKERQSTLLTKGLSIPVDYANAEQSLLQLLPTLHYMLDILGRLQDMVETYLYDQSFSQLIVRST